MTVEELEKYFVGNVNMSGEQLEGYLEICRAGVVLAKTIINNQIDTEYTAVALHKIREGILASHGMSRVDDIDLCDHPKA